MIPFQSNYSDLYDLFHANKNYEQEINELVLLFAELGIHKENSRILDFGCGTGKHLRELSSRGYSVAGYDRSEAMIEKARLLSPELELSTNLKSFIGKFDVVLSLFDVISYQTTSTETNILLSEVASVLKPGGYLVGDTWNKMGVEKDPPKKTEREVVFQGDRFVRKVEPHASSQIPGIYQLAISVVELSTQNKISDELHLLRAWSPEELEVFLKNYGFFEVFFSKPGRYLELSDPYGWRFAFRCKMSDLSHPRDNIGLDS
jgi:SAM-dependent methyltransferase